MNLIPPALSLANMGRAWHQQRRHVRVLVHRAYVLPVTPTSQPMFFIKVTNLSKIREVEITHHWFDTEPPFHFMNPARPLPTRLRLDELYETWVPVASVPTAPEPEWLVRVQLSNGQVVKSRLNWKVPPIGAIGGPGSR